MTKNYGQDGRRLLDIEAALRWAYRDELPKLGAVATRDMALRQGPARGGGGWDPISSFAQLLTCIDDNRYGVVPALLEGEAPHPDAVLIGDVVEALDDYAIGLPDDWNPVSDLRIVNDIVREGVARSVRSITDRINSGRRLFGFPTSGVVRHYALMGGCPVWEIEAPQVRFVMAHGKPRWFRRSVRVDIDGFGKEILTPIEVDGFNPTARAPHPDAYRKTELDPDPTDTITERAKYEVWHAALGILVDDLGPRLGSIRLTATQRPARPWEGGGSAVGAVLKDLGSYDAVARGTQKQKARRHGR